VLENLSVCIPTINRSHYLERALTYYSSVNFNGKILIGDESDNYHKKLNKECVKKFKNLNISYIHFEHTRESNDAKMLFTLSYYIKTPYVTFTGDDDFLVPLGAKKCVEFLENNPAFAAAHGVRLNFVLNENKIVHIDTDEGYEWINENAWERWLSYMRSGIATVSFIHRTENWEKQYELVGKMNCRYLGTELIICSIAAIQGKVKSIHDLSVVFQRENPDRLFSFRNHTLWDLINSPGWSESAFIFIEEIKRLMKEQGFDKEKEIEKEFWYHCLNILINQFNTQDQEFVLPTEPLELNLTLDDPFYPIYQLLTEGKI
jgi:glycosyltransferase domain-containing protein